MKKLILIVSVLCFLVMNVFAGNTITVSNTNDAGSGSLRVAINNLASNGDTIKFALSTYPDTLKLTSGQITINVNLTIIGLGDDSTIISGDNNSRIFNISAGDTVSIEKLTLMKGMVADSGGAVYNNGSLSIKYCGLKNNTGIHGGAILNKSLLSVTGSLLNENSASSGFGGAVFSSSGNFNASGCIFENNTSVTGGGAIACLGTSSFANITVSNNFSNKGGGLYSQNTLTISNSTISSNNANLGSGGGLYNEGNAKITSCILENNRVNNSGFSGGAIYSDNIIQLISSTVNNNFGAGNGGGITNAGECTIVNSTIRNNIANSGQGGGIISSSGKTYISNSTLSGNSADSHGGGISTSSNLIIERSTFSENQAGGNGGGIFTSDSLRFSNTIVAGNSANGSGPEIFNATGTPISLGHNLVSDIAQSGFNPGAGDILGTSVIPVDALLAPLANNGGSTLTYLPLCGSPAIDAGDTTGASSTDQRGEPRIYGEQIDIGAVEVQTEPVHADAIITDESSSGAGDGVIEAVITGGTPPYSYDWSNGSHNNTITGLSAGNYGLTVGDFFGCIDSTVFLVTLADGISWTNGKMISLFPNPTHDAVVINLALKTTMIEIFDVNGKRIETMHFNFPDELSQISLKKLPAGSYWITLTDTIGTRRLGKIEKL